ncbi:hypothetical protein [Candidatus Soleaferrea massiliensis]|uniref:hypothetical protein n=1 Tax=Candidatus Soleaferrea massiliensis TaxID=1470354 RepID=UPI00058BCCC8|nr:hypothetical protein [Candidatus Soleaferrea massiliensis]
MAFKISIVKDQEIVWDSYYVGKITCYPFETRDYKPYAQVILCYLPGRGFALRMWAFETHPVCEVRHPAKELLTDSVLAFRIQFDPAHSEEVLYAAFNRDGVVYANFTPDEVKPFEGEDLQGVYWGVQLIIPEDQIEKHVPRRSFAPGDRLRGNFYKLCLGSRPHQGSWVQLRQPTANLFDSNEFDDLILIDY